MSRAFLAASVTALAVMLAACGDAPDKVPPRVTATPTTTGTPKTVTRVVTDMVGRSVSVPDEVGRVVVLSPGAGDFASALGLEIVGRTTEASQDEAPTAKTVGSSLSPDFNAVAALEPELVIADAAYQAGRTEDFGRFAFPVFMLQVNSYPEVLAAMSSLGEATGRQQAAAAARERLESRANAAIEQARARAASSTPPKVVLFSGGGRDVFGAGSASYPGGLVELLGAKNVLGASPQGGPLAGFGVIEASQAASLNPEVVLILPSGQSPLSAQIKADPAWANTPAVRRGRVTDLDLALFLRAPGPRVVEALEALIPLLYP